MRGIEVPEPEYFHPDRVINFIKIINMGFEFLGYAWDFDNAKYYLDDLIFISKDKKTILWINYIYGCYMLYSITNKNKDGIYWQDYPLLHPFKPIILLSYETKKVGEGENWAYLLFEGKVYELIEYNDLDKLLGGGTNAFV